jgi:hypothetical protein
MENGGSEFTSLEQVDALVTAFESCSIPPREFRHRQHLSVALHYLIVGDPKSATESMRTGLKKFLAHHGIDGYNETITGFWLYRLNRCLTEGERATRSVACVNRVLAANADTQLIFQYYSREHLMSEAAKREWVDPDLKQLDD